MMTCLQAAEEDQMTADEIRVDQVFATREAATSSTAA